MKDRNGDFVENGDALEVFAVTEEQEPRLRPLFRQILASVGPILNVLVAGTVSGYSGVLLPQLHKEDETIHVSKEEESWIASMAPLPMAVGSMFGGWSADFFGRKKTLITCGALMAAGWLLIGFASSVEEILLGRLITGFSIGAGGPACTFYIAENSSPRYRGLLLATVGSAISWGLFLAHLLGTFFHWKTTALAIGAISVTANVLMIFFPESFVWYLNRKDYKRAKDSFFWMRGKNLESITELNATLTSRPSIKLSVRETFIECLKPQTVKPIFILIVYFITVQFAGSYVLAYYSVQVMKNAVPNVDTYIAMLTLDAIRGSVSIVACVLLKKFKVRTLTTVSGLGTALSLYSLAIFVFLSQNYSNNSFYNFMPVICFTVYIAFISIGIVPIPWSLNGELFPAATKGVVGGIAAGFNFLFLFIAVKTIPLMMDDLGMDGTFGVYGSFALTGTVILHFILPETRGKTLKEIEEHFVKKT